MAAFQLPAIQIGVPIVDPQTGRMTAYYSDWLNRILQQVVAQINTNSNLIAQLQATQAQLVATISQVQAVQAAAAQAQATADAAGGGGGQSGFATATLSVGSGGWSAGPQVDLTAVIAGNLTLAGTGPTAGGSTSVDTIGDFTGQWRIVEIVGAVETVVFPGTFSLGAQVDPDSGFTSYYLYNTTDTTSVSIPQTSTGAVSYRMDLILDNPVSAFFVVANLYARRA